MDHLAQPFVHDGRAPDASGRFSDSRLNPRPRLPILIKKDSGKKRLQSPVTAAGPSRIRTGFPF